jgi:hypothetical protein
VLLIQTRQGEHGGQGVVFLLPQGHEIPNWATKEGYWKATDKKDREIFKPAGGGREQIGMKKTLVFYMAWVPRGSKTN